MDVKFAKTDDLNAKLTVTLTPQDYLPAIDKELKDLQRKVSVPGFRPGKAPMGLVKKNYGRSVLVDEINRLASKHLFDYLRENNLDVLGQPLMSDTDESKINFDTEEDFVFAFDLGLAPSFDINFSKNDVLTRYKITIDNAMVEKEIEQLRKRHAEISDAETADERDVIYAEATELDENNQPFEGGVNNAKISLTADLVKNEDLKKQLTGISKDAEITVNIFELFNDNQTVISSSLNIPKEGVNDLNKNFRLKVTEIKHYTDAEINQELFDKIYGPGAVNSEEEFRTRVEQDLRFYYENEAEHQLEHEISHLISDNHKFDLPDAFLKRWLLESGNNNGYTPENVEQKYASEKDSLRYVLVREKFEKEHNLEITEEELEKASLGYTYNLFTQYGMYNPDPATVKAFSDEQLNKEDYRNRMRDIAVNRAVIATAKNMVTIEEKEVTADEFYDIIKAHNHAHHEHDHSHEHEGHDHEEHDHDHDHEGQHSH